MMRSLYSGVSGLRTHQTRMDVIGNNIANVNTVAYKSSSATFSELMYQTTQNASGPNAATGRGGMNAKQIGLGVQMGAINSSVGPGSAQSTGNPWDFMISGDSFFVVNDGSTNYFTRAGAFYVDGGGNLAMTTNGYKVMGWQPDPQNPTTIRRANVSPLKIMAPENMTSPPEATTNGFMSGIIDKNDKNVASTNGLTTSMQMYDSKGYSYDVKYSFYNWEMVGGVKTPLDDGVFRMEVTDLVDETGKSVLKPGETIDEYLVISGAPAATQMQKYIKYDTGNSGEFLGFADTSALASGIVTKQNNLSFDLAFKNQNGAGANNFPTALNVDMSKSTNVSTKGTSTISADPGMSDNSGNGAGKKVGEMIKLFSEPSGKIYASYDNGNTKLLGQIAVTTFGNPSGLEKAGENLYSATLNSGQFDGVGEDVTEGSGKIQSGVLEMSNVDLSQEFTEMITTQRGFQANSRIITVSDTMIEELTNLKR